MSRGREENSRVCTKIFIKAGSNYYNYEGYFQKHDIDSEDNL